MRADRSRRRFIAGAGIVAAAGVVPAVAKVPADRRGPDSRLARMIALYDRTEAQWDRFDSDIETPTRRACEAAIAAYPAEPLPPHEQAATAFVNFEGNTIRLTTEQAWLAGTARRVVSDPEWADMGDDDWRQAHHEIAAAHDRRDAIMKQQAARRAAFEKETRARYRMPEIVARSNALSDRCSNLWHAVVGTPAATLSDVAAKFAFIARTRGTADLQPDTVDAIHADVRRLAGEA